MIMSTYRSLSHWHDFQLRLFWEGIVSGIFAGLVISLFRYLLSVAETMRGEIIGIIASKGAPFIAMWLTALVLVAFILGKLTQHEPMAGGSGIPQVKGVILGYMRMNWLRILWVKLTAGVLALGAGLSLGREGPSIQLGAVTAQGLSRFLGRSRLEERYLITSGASAGLATAFNAPLSGVIFALEELHRNFSATVLLPAMASALTATFVSRLIFGRDTAFSFYGLRPLPQEYILCAIATAIAAGAAGVLFNKGLLNTGRFYSLPIFKNIYSKILFALLCAAVLAFALPQVLGGGNLLVNDLALKSFPLELLLILFVAKFLFTLISYGTGVPGGFFLPMLVLGALTGSICADIFQQMDIIGAGLASNIVIIAMAAFFSASVRAPITGAVLIMEMTGSFSHMMMLSIAAAVAYVVAELLGGEPIYEALLEKNLRSHATPEKNLVKKEKDVVEVAVCSGSLIENKKVGEIRWPSGSLLVDIMRGREQLVPSGDTIIRAGDMLYVLCDTENSAAVRTLGEELKPVHNVWGDF